MTRTMGVRRRAGGLLTLVTAAMLGSIGAASAATVTDSSAAVDTIYSQGPKNYDVRVNWRPTKTIYAGHLLSIDTEAEWFELIGLAPAPVTEASKIIGAFFVDAIGWCGENLANIVGCAEPGGYRLAVKSSYAAGDASGIDMAHEIGHLLGLDHEGDKDSLGNLMNPVLNSTVMTAVQLAAILGDANFQHIVDGDEDYYLLDIQPILVATPLPAAWAMMLTMLGIGGFWLRRRSAATQMA